MKKIDVLKELNNKKQEVYCNSLKEKSRFYRDFENGLINKIDLYYYTSQIETETNNLINGIDIAIQAIIDM